MGGVSSDDETPFSSQPLRAAAVICRTPYGNLHAGVLHREGTRDAVLHLGWQDTLYDDWHYQRLWAAPDAEPERLRSVAGYCRRIWSRFLVAKSFPYGLGFDDSTFSPDGQLRLGPRAAGLTCATFVLAVFNAVGVRLVDETTWPVRRDDDREWLETLRRFASPAHFARLEQQIEAGAVRIRPDEVLGACAVVPPAGFEAAAAAGGALLPRLPRLPGRPP